jgi:hypothetical protein
LTEVRTALSFPVDVINRSLLFTNFLEKEGMINRPQIIRFMQDHARNMERTWDNMQTLVSNMKPAEELKMAQETLLRQKTPELFKTPEAGGPSKSKSGAEASPDDMISTPDFVSPLQMGNFPPALTEILTP